jgi:anti-sigma regulatory factor (Ser/Thr protein kinase)
VTAPVSTAATATAAVRHYEQRFAGLPQTVGLARRFVRQVLDDQVRGGTIAAGTCDDAQLCVSELAGNAVRHTRSGGPEGSYRVIVETGPGGRVHVEVRDQGGADTLPQVLLGGIESGRGLWTCAALGVFGASRDRYGEQAGGQADRPGSRVWVDLPHPASPDPLPAPPGPAAPGVAHGADGSERR